LKIRYLHILASIALLIGGLTTSAVLAATYALPQNGDDVVGHTYTVRVQAGETIDGIAHANGVGLHEILEANPRVNPMALRVGQKVLIPAQYILPKYRKGIVINLPELRLYWFHKDGQTVETFPVGIGRAGWRTPTGITRVIKKAKNPVWNVPVSIRRETLATTGEELPPRVAPGPDNPLGPRALYLGLPGILIHGNNDPDAIGVLASAGCIRMFNQDVIGLYDQVETGTPVYVINQPIKAGTKEGKLYIEAHVPFGEANDSSNLDDETLMATISRGVDHQAADINWRKAKRVASEHRGSPKAVGNIN